MCGVQRSQRVTSGSLAQFEYIIGASDGIRRRRSSRGVSISCVPEMCIRDRLMAGGDKLLEFLVGAETPVYQTVVDGVIACLLYTSRCV